MNNGPVKRNDQYALPEGLGNSQFKIAAWTFVTQISDYRA